MKNFLLTLLFIFSLSAKLYVSDSVSVNANGCDYSLEGDHTIPIYIESEDTKKIIKLNK